MTRKNGVGRRRVRHCEAFSLVEVVLAIGVIVFGLVVIMALIPGSIRSSKQASEDMALSLMAQASIASLHQQGFSKLAMNAANTPPGTTTNYFDANGRMLTNSVGAIYTCVATPIAPPNAKPASVNSTNFVYVQLLFTWPFSAPPANQQTNIVVTSIGNYD